MEDKLRCLREDMERHNDDNFASVSGETSNRWFREAQHLKENYADGWSTHDRKKLAMAIGCLEDEWRVRLKREDTPRYRTTLLRTACTAIGQITA